MSAESEAALAKARAEVDMDGADRAMPNRNAREEMDGTSSITAEPERPDVTLGDVIERLEAADPERIVADGFGEAGSFRGYYDQVAFEPAKNVRVGYMLSEAKQALGATYDGYKGGRFRMTASTPCWIARHGESIGHPTTRPITKAWLDKVLTETPAPAPAEVGAVVGGEVEARTLKVGTLFRCGDDVYQRIGGFLSGRVTTHRVGSEYDGEIPPGTLVRPLTLRLVPAAPAPGNGTGEGGTAKVKAPTEWCYGGASEAEWRSRVEELKTGAATVADQLNAEIRTLKAALDKARADLAEAEARADREEQRRIVCNESSVRYAKERDAEKARADKAWAEDIAALAAERSAHAAAREKLERMSAKPATHIYHAGIDRTRWIADAALRLACADISWSPSSGDGKDNDYGPRITQEGGDDPAIAKQYAESARDILEAAERAAEKEGGK